MIQTRAYLKSIRLSPIKAGLVANAVRGKHVQEALDFLTFSKKKASAIVKKLLESAIANAEHNDKADIDTLFVKSIIVNQGMRLKRMKARARAGQIELLNPLVTLKLL
jgi:large subunit ribosomal protein L22